GGQSILQAIALRKPLRIFFGILWRNITDRPSLAAGGGEISVPRLPVSLYCRSRRKGRSRPACVFHELRPLRVRDLIFVEIEARDGNAMLSLLFVAIRVGAHHEFSALDQNHFTRRSHGCRRRVWATSC